MTRDAQRSQPISGLLGFGAGAIALIIVLVQFSAGPFAPQPDIATSVGEIAAEIRQSATRALSGEAAPPPAAAPWDIDRALSLTAAVLAGVAIILGLGALVRQETRAPAAGAIALGVGAAASQFVTWLVLVVLGVLLLVVIIQNIGDILGG